jgi:mitochondrial chaperone BCS1
MAIAGRFNLEIYILSLLETTDSGFIELLQTLPSSGCLLLLEDIDSAGLGRRFRPKAMETPASEASPEAEEKNPTATVTLSGLLNAIDGISSPEGHVLIMTTNNPEKLDSALIRSGRISVKVAFSHATRAQAQDMFLRQYQDEQRHSGEDSSTGRKLIPPDKKLLKMAASFADMVPLEEFTPADLQDYLIAHKDEPQEALYSFDDFKTKTFEERKLQALEREKELNKGKKARAQEAGKQAEASAVAMAKAMSTVSSGLGVSNRGRMKFW